MDTLIQTIYDSLQTVKDPEIPVISVLEMGIITAVNFADGVAKISMTPTFTGCPAIDYMKKDIRTAVASLDFVKKVEVKVDFKTPWTSNKISEEGLQKIRDFGLGTPAKHTGNIEEVLEINVACPVCKSTNTSMNSPFGPTLCRSVHKCFDCLESFEAFKPV